MIIATTIEELRVLRRAVPSNQSVGFVPTMGYLHAGHTSLVAMARRETQVAVAGIFVNPAQFGPSEDFSRYPRDPEHDLGMLRDVGVDWVFMPAVEEIYPTGFATYVEVRDVTSRLEGEARPGHFLGVATVVAKLFNIVQPSRAYFGQKDAQQVATVRKMVADLAFPLEIRVGETVREKDGLAMSSRNVYLNPEERQAALVLHKSLTSAQRLWESGVRHGPALRAAMSQALSKEPLARPDYVSVADPVTLAELDDSNTPRAALASLAVRIGKTRLIDNFLLGGNALDPVS